MNLILFLLACGPGDAFFGELGVDQTWNKCCDDALGYDPDVLWSVRMDAGSVAEEVVLSFARNVSTTLRQIG